MKNLCLKISFFFFLLIFLSACGKAATHTIKFISDGVVVSETTINDGEKVNKINDPVKDGYEFKGWKVENGDLFEFGTPITKDVTLVATFEEKVSNEVTVIFKNGDIVVKTESIVKGTKLSETTALSYGKDIDGFVGWLLNDKPFDYSIEIDKTITLVASISQKVTVTYKDGNEIFKQSSIEKGSLAVNEEISKSGAIFAGWLLDGSKFDFNTKVDKDITLVASWEEQYFEVTFVMDEQNEVVKVKGGEKAIAPQAKKTGYVFTAWLLDGFEFDINTAITANITLSAAWTEATDTVYTVRHLKENFTTHEFEVAETETFTGTTNSVVNVTPKSYEGWVVEYETYSVTIGADGLTVLDILYVNPTFSFKLNLNGGNTTYESRADLVKDLLKDYNEYGGYNYTMSSLPLGAWVNIDFHTFIYDQKYHDKWIWLCDYLGQVGSSTNAVACRGMLTTSSAAELEAKSENWKYAVSYEFRGFMKGIKYVDNANWNSSDYSKFDLANGFWNTYIKYREKVEYTDQTSAYVLPIPYKEYNNFIGWYDNPSFEGEPITVIHRTTTLYAKYELAAEVTKVTIDNKVNKLEKNDTLQLIWTISPVEALNKAVIFTSSNPQVVSVNDKGLITALNIGTAVITITTISGNCVDKFTVAVPGIDDLLVDFNDSYNGTLKVGESTKITLNPFGKLLPTDVTFSSTNENVITVDSNGNVKGVGEGIANIVMKKDGTTLLTISVTVVGLSDSEKVDQLLKLLIDGNRTVVDAMNVSLWYDGGDHLYQATYGSVNLFLFDSLNLDSTTYFMSDPVSLGKSSGIKSSTEFIVVHDTANTNGGLLSHGAYWKNPSYSTSIHFTVGDYGVVQSMDTKYVAYHAGDGTGTKFEWLPTSVKSNGEAPKIDISSDGYYTINGTKTTLVAPKKDGMILDSSYFSNLGIPYKVGDDGNYYISKTWLCTSQVSRGVIGSYGGNNNSIGIEMCVNTSGDIFDTWQRNAKLVAKLLIENNLDLTRVKQHNTFTGKNCPQSLIGTNYWDTFMEMVTLEYNIQKNFAGATISITSNNPELVDNTGRVIAKPVNSTSVTYKLSVSVGGVTKEVTLCSVIPGTATWNQLNGYFK